MIHRSLWYRAGRRLEREVRGIPTRIYRTRYRLPCVGLSTLVSSNVTCDPPILDDICLPPYAIPHDHDDYGPLIRAAKTWRPRVIVELGTAHGNTTANLCRACPEAKVITVNARPEQQTGALVTYQLTRDEIGRVYRAHGYAERVVQVYENTLNLDLSQYVGGSVVDLALIDACHDVEFVINDFYKVLPFVSPGGTVLFHDTHPRSVGHLAGSYMACMMLRERGYDIRRITGTWWGIWRNVKGGW